MHSLVNNKLSDFRQGFARIKINNEDDLLDSKLADAINSLANAARRRIGQFTNSSLLAHLENALPYPVKNSIGEYETLPQLLQLLEASYNNPSDLFNLRSNLENMSFTSNLSGAQQSGDFLVKLLLYNKRCSAAGRIEDKYGPFTMIKMIRDRLFAINEALAGDVMEAWNTHRGEMVTSKGALQAIVGRLEEKYQFIARHRAKKPKIMMVANSTDYITSSPKPPPRNHALLLSGERKWTCFRCGRNNQTNVGQKMSCCTREVCCTVPNCIAANRHDTKFHGAHMELLQRNPKLKHLFPTPIPRTQGGHPP